MSNCCWIKQQNCFDLQIRNGWRPQSPSCQFKHCFSYCTGKPLSQSFCVSANPNPGKSILCTSNILGFFVHAPWVKSNHARIWKKLARTFWRTFGIVVSRWNAHSQQRVSTTKCGAMSYSKNWSIVSRDQWSTFKPSVHSRRFASLPPGVNPEITREEVFQQRIQSFNEIRNLWISFALFITATLVEFK
jgi:hypothetical protein